MIFNSRGSCVRRFDLAGSAKGMRQQITWEGRDQHGQGVVSGIYFGRIVLNDGRKLQHKMMLIK